MLQTVGQHAAGDIDNAEFWHQAGFWYIPELLITGDGDDTVPLSFDLKQNFPNPFNPATTIRFLVTMPDV